MNDQRIAILVDSASDVPEKYIEEYNIYRAPLNIIYKDKEYISGVNITTEEVFARLDEEIPSTSLPNIDTIQDLFNQIKKEGYKKLLVVTVSSELSGTYNVLRMLGEEVTDLDIQVLDTKNVSLASGINAIQAANYIESGMNWNELVQRVAKNIKNTKVFFSVSTLKYIQKGGRLGRISSFLANALNLKPVISFNDEGITYAAANARGEKRSIQKALRLTKEYIGEAKKYNLGIIHALAKNKAQKVKNKLLKEFPAANILEEEQISSVLGVHVGPGGVGIVIQKL